MALPRSMAARLGWKACLWDATLATLCLLWVATIAGLWWWSIPIVVGLASTVVFAITIFVMFVIASAALLAMTIELLLTLPKP